MVTNKLLKILDYPLAAPSANISSKLSSVKVVDVKEEFGNKIDYILDGGQSKIGVESTIISLVNNPRNIKIRWFRNFKDKKNFKKKIIIDINPNKKVAPGQSKLHYSPGIRIRMNAKKPKKDEAYILLKQNKNRQSSPLLS